MSQITVIIPAYNAKKTIDACLQSIYQQTFASVTIVVVNDGSTDQTAAILEKHQHRITIVNQHNKGASAARNAGAKIATSPYLLFCDADIELEPMILERMYTALEHNKQVSYAYASFYFGGKLFKLWPFDPKRLQQMPYIHTTSLIRTIHFPGFDEKLKRFQDWDLWLTMYEQNHSGVFIDETLFKVHTGGTMSTWLPAWLYQFPWLPAVQKYKTAEAIIKHKHNIV